MSGIMQCPSCKENIDDDSRYCDQCGEQIFVCSVCGRPGKGKRCIFDGKEMVAAGTPPSAQPSAQQQTVQPPASPTAAPATSTPAAASAPSTAAPTPSSAPAAFAPSSAGEKIKLSSHSHGIIIEASNGDILGRTKGPFAGVLGRFSHISGAHCKLIKTAAGWSIEDTGSTNGTFYNNNRLAPNIPAPVQSGANIKLADLDLLITYGNAGSDGGTQRI